MFSARSTLGRGLIAGAAAATALAIWFLIIDGMAGRPFHTPAFLASLVLGAGTVTLALPQVAVYTLVHYAGFMAVGAGCAWLLDRFETVPGTLIGVILGFLLFDLLFYGSVWLTGTDVVEYLGWAEVLAGNVIAGVLLVGTLSLLGPSRNVSWGTLLAEHEVLREGIVVGLIGAVAVALWYLLLDLMGGQVFQTPATLGSIAFHGARSPAEIQLDAITVLGYTGLHLVAFMVVGLVAAALATTAEKHEVVILGAVLLFVTFETFFVGVLAIVAAWLLEVIPWWTFAVANLIAAASMGWYLWRRHPALSEALMRPQIEQERKPSVSPAGPASGSISTE